MPHALRAIVVEDEPPIQNIIIKVLGRCGYIVRAAGDGVEAINAFATASAEPDLICADIMMPKMDGREFAGHLRAQGVNVPIIFISALIQKGQEGYRPKSHVHLVAKPFSPEELARVVREMQARPRPAPAARRGSAPLKPAGEPGKKAEFAGRPFQPEDFGE